MYLLKFLDYFDIAGPLLGIAILLFMGHHKKAGGWHIVAAYLFLQLSVHIVIKILMLHRINNIRFYQLNAFFSLLLIGYWFLKEFKSYGSSRLYKFTWHYFSITMLVITGLIIMEDASALNSLSFSFASLSIAAYCIIYYYSNFLAGDGSGRAGSPSFWTVTAYFIFYCICFFIYIEYRYFTKNPVLNFTILWKIHNFILFISCLTLAYVNRKKE